MEYLKALLGLGVQPRGLNILFSIAEHPEPQYADWKERLWSGSGKLNRSEELGTARPRFCPPLKMSGPARMSAKKWKDRRGNTRIRVSKQWPDGSRFRGVQPNMTVAKKTLAGIEEKGQCTARSVRFSSLAESV